MLDFTAFYFFSCWNPAVLLPPEYCWPKRFWCRAPVGPFEVVCELELILLRKMLGSRGMLAPRP